MRGDRCGPGCRDLAVGDADRLSRDHDGVPPREHRRIYRCYLAAPQDRGLLTAQIEAHECGRLTLLPKKGDEKPVDLLIRVQRPAYPEVRGRQLPGDVEARGEVRGDQGGCVRVAGVPDRPVHEPGGADGQRADEGNTERNSEAAEDSREGLAPRGQRVGEGHRALLVDPGAGVRPTMRSPGAEDRAARCLYQGACAGDAKPTIRSSNIVVADVMWRFSHPGTA